MTKDELILWAKKNEIEALDNARGHVYFHGKAHAFSEIWELLLFDGKRPPVEEYNKANEEWSKKVKRTHKEEGRG